MARSSESRIKRGLYVQRREKEALQSRKRISCQDQWSERSRATSWCKVHLLIVFQVRCFARFQSNIWFLQAQKGKKARSQRTLYPCCGWRPVLRGRPLGLRLQCTGMPTKNITVGSGNRSSQQCCNSRPLKTLGKRERRFCRTAHTFARLFRANAT